MHVERSQSEREKWEGYMQIERKTLPEQHYLYVEKEVSMMNAQAIGEAMGSAFMTVFGFTGPNGITPLSMPMSLYMEMPNDGLMRFRGGVFVSAEDAAKASGEVKAGVIPAGDVYAATHVGPYSNMNVSHNALWTHMDNEGVAKDMPVWEVYVDDPATVPEAECRTEIFRAVG
tara:strand:+ start:7934 stop:8452 length:519 start_codon:yes stop_codon:yes gene_type:complete